MAPPGRITLRSTLLIGVREALAHAGAPVAACGPTRWVRGCPKTREGLAATRLSRGYLCRGERNGYRREKEVPKGLGSEKTPTVVFRKRPM